MAVYCSQSYFIQLKDKLASYINKLTDNLGEEPTSGTRMAVKNLLEILQANLDCLKGCGLELSDVIASEDDLSTFKSDLISSIKKLGNDTEDDGLRQSVSVLEDKLLSLEEKSQRV